MSNEQSTERSRACHVPVANATKDWCTSRLVRNSCVTVTSYRMQPESSKRSTCAVTGRRDCHAAHASYQDSPRLPTRVSAGSPATNRRTARAAAIARTACAALCRRAVCIPNELQQLEQDLNQTHLCQPSALVSGIPEPDPAHAFLAAPSAATVRS